MQLTTIVFPVREGKIFLANKKRGFGKGFLNGYGGKQQLDDATIEDTAIREMHEEGGVLAAKESLEKVAVIDFFKGGKELFQSHVFFCHAWEGVFQETEEMEAAEEHYLSRMPYERMWASDRVWVPLICSGKKIRATSYYNEEMTKQEHFEWKPL